MQDAANSRGDSDVVPNPILDGGSIRWLMVPDDEEKERFNVLVAGCSCSKVCNALTDLGDEQLKVT